jgi:hypothetical protein
MTHRTPPMPLTPCLHLPIRFRVTYGNKGKHTTESELPRYPGDVFDIPSSSTIGDLFYQLYLRYAYIYSHLFPHLLQISCRRFIFFFYSFLTLSFQKPHRPWPPVVLSKPHRQADLSFSLQKRHSHHSGLSFPHILQSGIPC